MKKIKRFLTIGLAIMLTFCVSISFAGCGLRLYESEYFIYTVGYESNEIGILGLTDKGKEQEYLVIPEIIDEKPVTNLDSGPYYSKKIMEKYGEDATSGFKSEKLKKVFIIPQVKVHNGEFFALATNLIAVFYISNDMKLQENLHHYNYYYPRSNAIFIRGSKYNGANVSYYYNYENAPNDGYYWIDNYGYGEPIEYIPANPIRDGYTFDGWYKESECMNVWNFEADSLPQVQYGKYNREIYQETKLYAKWIKE